MELYHFYTLCGLIGLVGGLVIAVLSRVMERNREDDEERRADIRETLLFGAIHLPDPDRYLLSLSPEDQEWAIKQRCWLASQRAENAAAGKRDEKG